MAGKVGQRQARSPGRGMQATAQETVVLRTYPGDSITTRVVDGCLPVKIVINQFCAVSAGGLNALDYELAYYPASQGYSVPQKLSVPSSGRQRSASDTMAGAGSRKRSNSNSSAADSGGGGGGGGRVGGSPKPSSPRPGIWDRHRKTMEHLDKSCTQRSSHVLPQGAHLLDQSKSLKEQGFNGKDHVLELVPLTLFADGMADSVEDASVEQDFTDLRKEFVTGAWPCTVSEAAKLAALNVHASSAGINHTKKQLQAYLKACLPQEYQKDKSATNMAMLDFTELAGSSVSYSKEQFVQHCKQLPTFQAIFFAVKAPAKKRHAIEPCILAISSTSIVKLNAKTKQVMDTWKLTDVADRGISGSTFSIRFRDQSCLTVMTYEAEVISEALVERIQLAVKLRKQRRAKLAMESSCPQRAVAVTTTSSPSAPVYGTVDDVASTGHAGGDEMREYATLPDHSTASSGLQTPAQLSNDILPIDPYSVCTAQPLASSPSDSATAGSGESGSSANQYDTVCDRRRPMPNHTATSVLQPQYNTTNHASAQASLPSDCRSAAATPTPTQSHALVTVASDLQQEPYGQLGSTAGNGSLPSPVPIFLVSECASGVRDDFNQQGNRHHGNAPLTPPDSNADDDDGDYLDLQDDDGDNARERPTYISVDDVNAETGCQGNVPGDQNDYLDLDSLQPSDPGSTTEGDYASLESTDFSPYQSPCKEEPNADYAKVTHGGAAISDAAQTTNNDEAGYLVLRSREVVSTTTTAAAAKMQSVPTASSSDADYGGAEEDGYLVLKEYQASSNDAVQHASKPSSKPGPGQVAHMPFRAQIEALPTPPGQANEQVAVHPNSPNTGATQTASRRTGSISSDDYASVEKCHAASTSQLPPTAPSPKERYRQSQQATYASQRPLPDPENPSRCQPANGQETAQSQNADSLQNARPRPGRPTRSTQYTLVVAGASGPAQAFKPAPPIPGQGAPVPKSSSARTPALPSTCRSSEQRQQSPVARRQPYADLCPVALSQDRQRGK